MGPRRGGGGWGGSKGRQGSSRSQVLLEKSNKEASAGQLWRVSTHHCTCGGKGVPVPARFCNLRKYKQGQTEVSRQRAKAEAVWMLTGAYEKGKLQCVVSEIKYPHCFYWNRLLSSFMTKNTYIFDAVCFEKTPIPGISSQAHRSALL